MAGQIQQAHIRGAIRRRHRVYACTLARHVISPTPSLLPPADPLALQFALHGSIALLLGLIGGLFFARAIKTRHGEVAWRVVHAGGCSAGAMLLAIAMP